MNRTFSIVSVLLVTATAAVLSTAHAQPVSRDTGFGVWRQFCAGCHDSFYFSPITLPKIREIGEPRVRRALYDNDEEAIHYYGDRIPKARMDLLIAYLKPDADKSLDCGPPGANMSPTPQCPDTGVPIGPPPNEKRAP